MGGRLAKAYASLVRQVWSGKMSSVIPREFKYTVGQFAPTFSGYHQQDSQELMAFLLDGLHEDLNRIRNKPYVELKEAEGRPDEVVAPEAWEDYKRRNDSIITDLLHGQLKSTLVCPTCDKVSVKFDPFCFLSLPMPVKKERQLVVTFVSDMPDFTWTKYKVGVPKLGGTTKELFTGLAKLTKKSPECMVLAELTASRIRKFFRHNDDLSDVSDRDELYVYELPKVGEPEQYVTICLYQRCLSQYDRLPDTQAWRTTAQPIVFKLHVDNLTPSRLHEAVLQRAKKVFPELSEDGSEWWKEEAERGTGDGNDGNDSGLEENEGSSHQSTPMDTDEADTSSSSSEREMYTLRKVNEFGTTIPPEVIPRDGEDAEMMMVAVLTKPMYFSADWDPVAYRKFIAPCSWLKEVKEDESVRAIVTRKQIDLQDCLRLFNAKEKLGKDDLWYCPGCKEFREASKQMGVWTAPRLLVMHLKRFSYTRTLRDKIENPVEFPLKGLDLGPFILSNKSAQPILYDLVAVSNHMGGLGGGHYTAFGLNKNNNRWYSFDDSCVSPVSEESVVSKMAYVLVFAQRPVIGSETDPNVESEMDE